MYKISFKFIKAILLFLISCSFNQPEWIEQHHSYLEIKSDCKDAQIEIGGPYAGIELHHSSPLLNRISFFYPLANSIDRNMDYWSRDTSRILFIGLRKGEENKQWLGFKPYEFKLTPYSVTFNKTDIEKDIYITYRFCRNKPAMIMKIEIVNNSNRADTFELYTHLDLTLRTSHTYAFKRRAWSEYDENLNTITFNYDDVETGNVRIFITNIALKPKSYTTRAQTSDIPYSNNNWWFSNNQSLPNDIIEKDNPERPVAAFIYKKHLEPQQKMTIIQIFGSCKAHEHTTIIKYLKKNYMMEAELYEKEILNSVFLNGIVKTGDNSIDHSIHWAKAIISSNLHYLDGEIVPMPCPAEYNFFFTHDVLLTDLSVVNFDIQRVKKDLIYILNHADNKNIIPHAYYWKDTEYLTEYAGSDNWNHLWFVILSARYFKHSNDRSTMKKLYPLLDKSINLILKNIGEDNLMWGHQPDWWDIGNNYGPRSYLTILTIRALRDFVYISTILNKDMLIMKDYWQLSIKMEEKLNQILWNDDLNYLINYMHDGSMDKHYYIGSLLGVHFDLISDKRKKLLTETAERILLDDKIGIYNVYPVDFHLLIEKYNFNKNEAGNPFYYANGGIWSHGNAWFALALISIREGNNSLKFIKNTMTLGGIINSPNGQPAMYEYRTSDFRNPEIYGKVDKPQFLWAAGWFIYSLYYLLGFRENVWNISILPALYTEGKNIEYNLYTAGNSVRVIHEGISKYIKNIKYNGIPYPSSVLPELYAHLNQVEICYGKPDIPILYSTNSVLNNCSYNKDTKEFLLVLKAYPKHPNKTFVISPIKPESLFINKIPMCKNLEYKFKENIFEIEINFKHKSTKDTVIIKF